MKSVRLRRARMKAAQLIDSYGIERPDLDLAHDVGLSQPPGAEDRLQSRSLLPPCFACAAARTPSRIPGNASRPARAPDRRPRGASFDSCVHE